MYKSLGFRNYKRFWEDQAGFIDKYPWHSKKILRLTISNDFANKIKELKFSNHSISKDQGKLILSLKVPYNYFEIDDFKLKTIELLGIEKSWLLEFNLGDSRCTRNLNH